MRNIALASAAAVGLAMSVADSGRIEVAPRAGEGKAKRPARTARANIGRNHPDYGLSVAEHAANKLKRTGRPY